jgi:GTP-binding protein HflX
MNLITNIIKKDLCVLINRRGKITGVSVGKIDSSEIQMEYATDKKLCGIRVIHARPSGENALTSTEIAILLDLKLDAIVVFIAKEVTDFNITIGFCSVYNKTLIHEEHKNLSLETALVLDFKEKVNFIDALVINDIHESIQDNERAILVGTDSEESLQELFGLAEACNILPVYKVFQNSNKINSTLYAGQGKIEEIIQLRQQRNANTIIFDDELSGSQVRNLEKLIKCKVIDRTTLILDIFAKRAKSKEGILQVELARLNHQLPRLRNSSANLSRIKGGVGVKGGIGSRGPGEKKIEMDRRHIESRIEEIKKELAKITAQRAVQKVNRIKNNISKVAIIGYTNAGKSTLRNKLCEISPCENIKKEGVLEADMLFATLDTTVRAILLKDNRKITLSDTIGFINKLPHELVEAFKSTLEDVVEADLLLHVVDASNENAVNQIDSVNIVLKELNVKDKNTIVVLNKVDKTSTNELDELKHLLKNKNIIEVCAASGTNLKELLDMVGKEIPIKLLEKDFIIPYSEQKLVSTLHERSSILNEDYWEEGTHIKALVQEEIYKLCVGFESTDFN